MKHSFSLSIAPKRSATGGWRLAMGCLLLLVLLFLSLLPLSALQAATPTEEGARRQTAERLASESPLLPLEAGANPGQWIGRYHQDQVELPDMAALSLPERDWNSSCILIAKPQDPGTSSEPDELEAKAQANPSQERLEYLASRGQDQRLDPAESSQLLLALLFWRGVDEGRIKQDQAVSIKATDLAGLADKEVPVTGIPVGEKRSAEELLDLMLRRNAHDAARALARTLYPDKEEFFRQLSNLALGLGLKQSRFHSVSGLSHKASDSQAQDLLLLFVSCMQEPRIRKQLSLLPEGSKEGEASGDLIFAEELKEVYGDKSPAFRFVKAATDRRHNKQILLAAYDLNGQDVYVLLAGSNWRYQYLQDMQAIDAMLNQEGPEISLLRKGAYLADLAVSSARYQGKEVSSLPVYAPQDQQLKLGRLDHPERYSLQLLLPESLKAPVEANTTYGYLELRRKDHNTETVVERLALQLEAPLELSRRSRLAQILRWILALGLGISIPLFLSYLLFLSPRLKSGSRPKQPEEPGLSVTDIAAEHEGGTLVRSGLRSRAKSAAELRPGQLRDTAVLALEDLPQNRAYIDAEPQAPHAATQQPAQPSALDSQEATRLIASEGSEALAAAQHRAQEQQQVQAASTASEEELLQRFMEASRQHEALEEAWKQGEWSQAEQDWED